MNNFNPTDLVEASKIKRFWNFIIDLTIRISLLFLFAEISKLFNRNEALEITAIIFIFAGYYILLEFIFGRTIGKMITKTRVVDKNGNKIDFRAALIRYITRWIPFEFISLGLGHDAKAWHDLLSGTRVIEDN